MLLKKSIKNHVRNQKIRPPFKGLFAILIGLSLMVISISRCQKNEQKVPTVPVELSPKKQPEPKADDVQGKKLQDVDYTFNKEKLTAVNDTFHFLRSYVDYFYQMISVNVDRLPSIAATRKTSGWCVGDAHAENFGVLLQSDGSPLFTMNDVDDSGPCPVVLDIFRLMLSSRLYDQSTQLDKILEAYYVGIQSQTYPVPLTIQEMMKKSFEKGFPPSSTRVANNKIVRDPKMKEVTPEITASLSERLAYISHSAAKSVEILDIIETEKVGGGSGGLLRYEILIRVDKDLVYLELKDEVTPSIYPMAIGPIPQTFERVMKTLTLDQGMKLSPYYNVVEIPNHSLMVRPIFAGNSGITLSKFSADKNKDIILFEAFTLGIIHSHSMAEINDWVKSLQAVDSKTWESDVASMTTFFDQKFSQVKN